VESLFERLRDLPPEDRRTVLESQGDAETVVEVVSLLSAHDAAEDFLAEPAFAHPEVSEEQWTSDIATCERIGPYRITRVLGAGGMGVLLEARQEHPDRAVALKLLRGGPWIGERHVRLFRREVETLARLEHDDIARVHDAGCTEDGQHWFTMELVHGEPLDAFVGRTDLSVRGRMKLFRRVCAAVAYAHQRGVIHCDLKPSNVLVAQESGAQELTQSEPSVKILDFGLARVLRMDDDDASEEASRPGGMQGSLSWMSPEQARGDDAAIDVRSDVYALGVILHQLLTDELPYDLQGLVPHEAVREICERSPASVPSSSPRDLVTIRTKALEKSPDRRYAGAFELAEDIRRWLGREPILAHPPSATYRTLRALQRHRVAATALATVMMLLVGFSIYAASQADRLENERDEARRQREEAEYQRSIAKRLTDWWSRKLRPANPGRSADPNVRYRDVLHRSGADIDGDFADAPVIAAELHHRFARLWKSLSLLRRSVFHLERAVELRREALGDEHTRTLSAMNDLAAVYHDIGRRALALQLHTRVLRARRKLLEPRDDRLLLTSINNLGNAFVSVGRYAEAKPLLDEALMRRRRAFGESHFDTLSTKNNLASMYTWQGDFDRAEPLLIEVLNERRSRLAAHHPKVLLSVVNLATLLMQRGRRVEAASMLQEARETAERNLGPDHLQTLTILATLSRLRRDLGERESATKLANVVFERTRALTGPESPATLAARFKIARLHSEFRDFEKAAVMLEELVEIHRRVSPRTLPEFRDVINALTVACGDLGSWRRARKIIEDNLDFLGEELDDDHPSMLVLRGTLGSVLDQMGESEAALSTLRQAHDGLVRVEGASRQHALMVATWMARAYLRAGKTTEAEKVARQAYEALEDRVGIHNRHTLAALRTLASALMVQRRWAEAEPLLGTLAAAMKETTAEPDVRAIALFERGRCMLQMERLEEAENLFREGDAVLQGRAIHPSLGGPEVLQRHVANMVKVLEGLGKTDEAATWRARLADR